MNDHDTLIEIKTIVDILQKEMTNHLKHHLDRRWMLIGAGVILLGSLAIQIITKLF